MGRMARGSKRCQPDLSFTNSVFLSARAVRIFILVSFVPVSHSAFSQVNDDNCESKRNRMNRTLLFLLSSLLLIVVTVGIALYVPTALPTNSDFSALYNTDLALVNRIPIYDLQNVEVLAQQHSGIPA